MRSTDAPSPAVRVIATTDTVLSPEETETVRARSEAVIEKGSHSTRELLSLIRIVLETEPPHCSG